MSEAPSLLSVDATVDSVKRPKSFCIPRKAVEALLQAKADVHTIAAYLVLACFTEESGRFTTASTSAMRRYLRSDRKRCLKAMSCLLQTTAKHQGRNCPLVYRREEWLRSTDMTVPDGPTQRSKVQYILHPFDEELVDRVWFGSGLVEGIGSFQSPLHALKQCGDLAARLLLVGYLNLDTIRYCAINPHAYFFRSYSSTKKWNDGRWFLDHVSCNSTVGTQAAAKLACGQVPNEWTDIWDSLAALVERGFLYEVVTVLSGAPVINKNESYEPRKDAELLYVLDCLSKHGEVPRGEGGLAAITAKTAGELGVSVAQPGGRFDGTYAVIGSAKTKVTVAGLFRPRFRVTNTANFEVKEAWFNLQSANEEAFRMINALRRTYRLTELNWSK